MWLRLTAGLAAVAAGLLAASVSCVSASGGGGGGVLHARLVGLGAVPLFYGSVAAWYVSSMLPRGLLGAGAPLLFLHALLLGLPVLLPGAAGVSVAAAAALGLGVSLAAARLGARARREAALLMASAYAVALASPLLLPGSPLARELMLLYLVAVPGIVAVNMYSLLRTYSRGGALLAGMALNGLLAAGLAWRSLSGGAGLLAVFFAAYAAATLAGAGLGLPRLRSLRGDPRRAHAYYLLGQLGSAAASAVHAALLASGADLVSEAHSLAMGFIAFHVYTHAPLMLPTMLGLPAS
ncbi:MAG: hypothetical protein GXO15_05930, partial [Crenarchaeota archaeon]|nr:hypothetical protein [Thermoproteota archaeon]